MTTPNCILWNPYLTGSNDDYDKEVFQRLIDLGVNTMPVGNRWDICQNPLTVQTDDEVIDRWLRIQEYFDDIPICYNANFGLTHSWAGNYNNPVIGALGYYGSSFDPNMYPHSDPCGADYLEVYHTFIQSLATEKGGLKELFDFQLFDPAGMWYVYNRENTWRNVPDMRVIVGETTNYFHMSNVAICPNYRGTKYAYALAKFTEYVKWLKPLVTAFDIEHITGAFTAPWYNHLLSGLPGATVLNNCTACAAAGGGNGVVGFQNGLNSMMLALTAVVKSYNANAICTQLDACIAPNVGESMIWPVSPATGLTHGSPMLYGLTPVAKLYADYPDDFEQRLDYWQSGQAGTDPYGLYWRVRPEALGGSYPWLSQYRNCSTNSDWDAEGYLTPDEFYQLCYILAERGAKGFTMWPAWTGINTADDNAALLLIPEGIQAFADYEASLLPGSVVIFYFGPAVSLSHRVLTITRMSRGEDRFIPVEPVFVSDDLTLKNTDEYISLTLLQNTLYQAKFYDIANGGTQSSIEILNFNTNKTQYPGPRSRNDRIKIDVL